MAQFGIGDEVLGGWRIVREIGSGGFGTVFEVDKPGRGFVARAALKVIPVPPGPEAALSLRAEGMDDASIAAYFRDVAEACAAEAGALASLGHPGVVAYQDHDLLQDGQGWEVLLRMELLEPLADRCAQGLAAPEVARLGAQVADALAFCHERGYIHRDVKPQNVFVDASGRYKIGDFGVARVIEGTETTLTRAGTPPYMAPELLMGAHAGPKVDVYSLGVMLYQLLNGGRLPFYPPAPEPVTPAARSEAFARRLRGELPSAIPGTDPTLMGAVLSACRADPSERPTAAELRDELQAWSRGASGPAAAAPNPTTQALHEPTASPSALLSATALAETTAGVVPEPTARPASWAEPKPRRFGSPATVVDLRAPETAGQVQRSPWPPASVSPRSIAPASVPEPPEQAAQAPEPANDDLAARTYDAWSPFGEAPLAQVELEQDPKERVRTERAAAQQQAPEPAPAVPEPKLVAASGPKPTPAPARRPRLEQKGRSMTRRAVVAGVLAAGAGGLFLNRLAVSRHASEVQASVVFAARSDWTDVVAIESGENHSLGVHRDGTVVAAGGNTYGQCNVSGWTDIVAVSAYDHSIGLRSDGTAVATGLNTDGQCEVSEWKDLVAVAAGFTYSLGLRSDGSVLVAGDHGWLNLDEIAKGWSSITAVSASFTHALGLRQDGTAVVWGDTSQAMCDVGGWTDLVALSAGEDCSIGLHSDGTAVAVGDSKSIRADIVGHLDSTGRELDVTQWTDVVAVAAWKGFGGTGNAACAGLRSDGTVHICGDANSYASALNWTDLVAVSLGDFTMMGLKKDGSVLILGSYKRSDGSWTSAVPGEA